MLLPGRFAREVTGPRLPEGAERGSLVTEGDLAGLPEPAQRYLRFMAFNVRPVI
jgi:hypothetical protein